MFSHSCGANVQTLTLNLFSNCSMTWFVVIPLEIRTLVGVPKDGVKIDVWRKHKSAAELWYLKSKVNIMYRKFGYLIVIEVPIDRKAMLSFFLSLCR